MTGNAMMTADNSVIAVITPTYKHPTLLSEAIESVKIQNFRGTILHLVINDGCPFEQSDMVVRAYASSCKNLYYIKKVNGGPGSARNRGINYLIDNKIFPDAVYFLDADNRLSSNALQIAYDALMEDTDTDWVYTSIDTFGIKWSGDYDIQYSALLHIIYDNLCDTGSMIKWKVLASGVRFDEDHRAGYEDWDFWLSCIEKGFRGKYVPFGFTYRQRAESRNRDNGRTAGEIKSYLRRRHPSITDIDFLERLEHIENPKYGLYDSCSQKAYYFSGGKMKPRIGPILEAKSKIAACMYSQSSIYVPHIHIWGSAEFFYAPELRSLVNGILFNISLSSLEHGLTIVQFEASNGEIASQHQSKIDQELPTMIFASHAFIETFVGPASKLDITDVSVINFSNASIIKMSLPMTENRQAQSSGTEFKIAFQCLLDFIKYAHTARNAYDHTPKFNWRVQIFPPRHTYASILQDYIGTGPIFSNQSGQIYNYKCAIVVPIASYGGADKVSYALARYLKEMGFDITLCIVGSNRMDIISEYFDSFSNIVFFNDPNLPKWGGPNFSSGQNFHLAGSMPKLEKNLLGLLAPFDLVVNCHCAYLNTVVGDLRRMGIRTISYLHVTDRTELGRFVGHTYLFSIFEHAYDLAITCSMRLLRELYGLGVPEQKMIYVKNSAGFQPVSMGKSNFKQMRISKASSSSINVIYLGRLDRQKGINRLIKAVESLKSMGTSVNIRVVGSSMFSAGGEDWSAVLRSLEVIVEPPVYDAVDLQEYFLWSDILLLPSRWEGAPLVIAEAQQYGCIPIAAAVGAVDEMIEDGKDGFVIDSDVDHIISETIALRIEELLYNVEKRIEMSLNCLERMEENTWQKNFIKLNDWLKLAFPDVSLSYDQASGSEDTF